MSAESNGNIGIDTKMRFSLWPLHNTETSYDQWISALKSMTRFPDGIPTEFRKHIWLNLANYYIKNNDFDWTSIRNSCFNDSTNPDDYDLDAQIIKDLHRTNSAGVPGTSLSSEDRIILKRVLLAFARWNKKIGYCQGLNVIAALIIEVMEQEEESALKVMIYLIDHVLPPRYYSNKLTGLTVDMTVFRDLLDILYPHLAKQLDKLRQKTSHDETSVTYEPPLTNLFIMQWFITLFATCFPRQTVLHLWDCLFIWGSEILIRTALVFWKRLTPIALMAQNADQFYSLMDDVLKKSQEPGKIPTLELIKDIFDVAPFPFREIEELRDKYTYNISPFMGCLSPNKRNSLNDNSVNKVFDFGISKLIQSLNQTINSKKSSKINLKPKNTDFSHTDGDDDLLSKTRPYMYDVKNMREEYKKICQNHRKSMLVISKIPNIQKFSNSDLHYEGQSITGKHKSKNEKSKFLSDSQNTVHSNIPDIDDLQSTNNYKNKQENQTQLYEFEDNMMMNHLYLKPGHKAKNQRNRKIINYTNIN